MRVLAVPLTVTLALAVDASAAWKNGPEGHALADRTNPPYSTHDWVADHARDLLTDNEKAWLEPHRAMFLLGTEAPELTAQLTIQGR